MKLLGILLIINAATIAIWWVSNRSENIWPAIFVCGFIALGGLALTFHERVTELTIAGIGTIKTATEQATADAKAISDLKIRMENQSATVDLVAKQAATAKTLAEQLEEQSKKAAAELLVLDQATSEAKAALSQIKSLLEFTETIVAAQNDDRSAFDRLDSIAKSKSNPFATKAKQAWLTIFETHSSALYNSGFSLPWAAGFDPTKLTIADLSVQFHSAPPELKPALLEYIKNREDIPKVDRMDFLLGVLRVDSSLRAAEYAGRYFTLLAGLQVKPLAVDYLVQWWNDHRSNFENK